MQKWYMHFALIATILVIYMLKYFIYQEIPPRLDEMEMEKQINSLFINIAIIWQEKIQLTLKEKEIQTS